VLKKADFWNVGGIAPLPPPS